jgi:hypothetical protein
MLTKLIGHFESGLPDFSCYKLPNFGENIPNSNKANQKKP